LTLESKEKNAFINYRIERSKLTVEEASSAIKNKQFFSAVNRIYYSIYYMLSALSLKNDFSTSKHSQLIGWFNKEFIVSGKIDKKYGLIVMKAFKNRSKGDYSDFAEFSEEQVNSMFSEMQDLISELEKLIKK
jgi:uncharacterized protein (UPF0332 family)